MQELIDSARDWWAVFAGLVAAGFWFARLEGRGRQNRQDITTETRTRTEALKQLEERLDKQRAEDRAARDRDWSQMNARLDTIQTDIKEILKGIRR